jgi:hypothetical protein
VVDHLRGDFAVSAGPGSEITALDNTTVHRSTILRATASSSSVAMGAIVRGGTVTDSNVWGAVAAIAAQGGITHPGSRLERNVITAAPGVGISVDESDVRVADNTVRQCAGTCIRIVGAGSCSVVGNRLGLAAGGTGIDIEGVFNLIDGNLVFTGAAIAGTTGWPWGASRHASSTITCSCSRPASASSAMASTSRWRTTGSGRPAPIRGRPWSSPARASSWSATTSTGSPRTRAAAVPRAPIAECRARPMRSASRAATRTTAA